jgi:hypothetical protein
MTDEEFLERYKETVVKADVSEGEGGMDEADRIGRVRVMLGLSEGDIVIGKERVIILQEKL